MRLAVSSYSFQQRIKKGEMTQFDTIREAARMGFDGIEFTDLRPENDPKPTLEEQLAYAKRLREEAAAEGVEIVGYMVGANLYRGSREADDAEVDRLKGQLDVAAAMGAKLFRHDVCYSEKLGEKVVGFDRMLPTIAENARRITEYAQALGSEPVPRTTEGSRRTEIAWSDCGWRWITRTTGFFWTWATLPALTRTRFSPCLALPPWRFTFTPRTSLRILTERPFPRESRAFPPALAISWWVAPWATA